MLSPNWHHVTLRLTVFEIIANKWLFRGSKLRILGALGGTAPKMGADRSGTYNIHVPCKITRQSVAPLPKYMSSDKKHNHNRFNIQPYYRLNQSIKQNFFTVAYNISNSRLPQGPLKCQSAIMSVNDFLNKNVLRRRWKVDRYVAEVISSGSRFHVWGPETEKARLPIVDSLTAGTSDDWWRQNAKPVGQLAGQRHEQMVPDIAVPYHSWICRSTERSCTLCALVSVETDHASASVMWSEDLSCRDVHGNRNIWDPMVPWDSRGNGSDSDYIMGMGMGVGIKVWEWE